MKSLLKVPMNGHRHGNVIKGTFILPLLRITYSSQMMFISMTQTHLKFLWHRLRMTGKENQNLREQETATPTFLIPVVRSSLTESLGFKNLFSKELANKSGNWFYQKETGLIFINFGNLKPKDQLIEISTRRRIFAPHSIGIGHIIVEGFVMEHCGNQYPTNFWSTPKWAQAGALGLRGGHHWIVRKRHKVCRCRRD